MSEEREQMFGRKTDRKIEMLMDVPALASFGEEALSELSSLADLVPVPGDTTIIREGERGTEVFLIVEGEVLITQGDDETATRGPGEFVGEMALLDRGPRSATVTTRGDVEVLVFDARAFDRMVRSSPVLTRELITQMTTRFRVSVEE